MSGARQLINPYPEYTEEPSEVISSQREAKTRRMPATLKISGGGLLCGCFGSLPTAADNLISSQR